MSVTCPKCQHIRPLVTDAPDWQCPACGVAYAKAAVTTTSAAARVATTTARRESRRSGWPLWIKGALTAGVLILVTIGWQITPEVLADAWGLSEISSGGMSTEQVTALAATVKPGEVVMYSTSDCGYCTQAKDWLTRHGFAFSECNMSSDERCVDEFVQAGAKGTPHMVVRGRHMRDGFDGPEFLALLKQ